MIRKFKRALTLHQSDACTLAIHPRCTCRCGGLLHGADHKDFMEIESQIIKADGNITADQVADIIDFLKGEDWWLGLSDGT